MYDCICMFRHHSVVNPHYSAARLTLSPNHKQPILTNSPSTHTHTPTCIQAKWSTKLYVIDCEQGYAQDNTHTLHQAWQTVQADGAHDKQGEKKLVKEKKKRKVDVFEPYTHVLGGPYQSSGRGFLMYPRGLSFEYINLPVTCSRQTAGLFIHTDGLSVSQLVPSPLTPLTRRCVKRLDCFSCLQ